MSAARGARSYSSPLVGRLINLGDRAFHHDQSQVAYFSYLYWRDHAYAYNPLLHGPWDMVTAATYAIAGVPDFTARLAAALHGVGLPYFARRQLGRTAVFSSGVILVFSPSLLW